ncbi:unnamed protein product [Brassica rapa]|uniref:RING-type domain-containing protein n=1 Tax=Brassica campestris TaxID=3711 RepID=A0A8D9G8K1_BRACM|nr:unnamed protein product [Brassica rapa]
MNRVRAIWREEEKREEGGSHEPPPTMPVKKQGDGGGDQQQQQLHRFDPEAEENNQPEDLQDSTLEKKDDEQEQEEVKRDEAEKEEEEEDGDEEPEEDSKEISPSADKSEFMEIDLGEIRKDVQCPICLGIIKKTRTVMECLHRFCRECIDKSMRLGNNECPACRKHCASRRSLRDDPKFDALIAALFTNIDSYEEEEFAFHEDDKARNKQIQASIAEISQRQSEALVKRKSFGKEAVVLMRSQRSGSGSRRRRNSRNTEQNADEAHEDDDNNEDHNNNNNGGGGGGRDSSSDERGPEVRVRKRRKRSANNNNGNCGDKDTEVYRDSSKGISPGLVWNPEMLAWGRSATRSNPRHENNTTGGSSKSVRNARVNKLVEYLKRSSVDGKSVEVDIDVKLVSLDTKCVPDLPQPYLCCRPTFLVKQLREFVALKMHLKTEDVELLVKRGLGGEDKAIETLPASAVVSKDEMQSLEDNETLSKLKTDFNSSQEQHLLYVEDPNYFTRGATSACSSKSYKEKCVSSSSTQNKHYGPSPNVMTLVDLEDEMKEDLMANDLE